MLFIDVPIVFRWSVIRHFAPMKGLSVANKIQNFNFLGVLQFFLANTATQNVTRIFLDFYVNLFHVAFNVRTRAKVATFNHI